MKMIEIHNKTTQNRIIGSIHLSPKGFKVIDQETYNKYKGGIERWINKGLIEISNDAVKEKISNNTIDLRGKSSNEIPNIIIDLRSGQPV